MEDESQAGEKERKGFGSSVEEASQKSTERAQGRTRREKLIESTCINESHSTSDGKSEEGMEEREKMMGARVEAEELRAMSQSTRK